VKTCKNSERVSGTRKYLSASDMSRKIITNHPDERLRQPLFVKTVDKVAFVLGVLNMVVTEYFLLKAPQSLWKYYLLLIGPLMILR